jgi:hypothetical protein
VEHGAGIDGEPANRGATVVAAHHPEPAQ